MEAPRLLYGQISCGTEGKEWEQRVNEFLKTLQLEGTKIGSCGFSSSLCDLKDKIKFPGDCPVVLAFNCHAAATNGNFEDSWPVVGKFHVTPGMLWRGADPVYLRDHYKIEHCPWDGLRRLLDISKGPPNGGFPIYIVFGQCHGMI